MDPMLIAFVDVDRGWITCISLAKYAAVFKIFLLRFWGPHDIHHPGGQTSCYLTAAAASLRIIISDLSVS